MMEYKKPTLTPLSPARVAIADTPTNLNWDNTFQAIYDDTPGAVPLDEVRYDLGTCSEKHSRMTALQAQRIDELWTIVTDLQLQVRHLKQTIDNWTADE